MGQGSDLAVLKLSEPLTEQEAAGAVCLPSKPVVNFVGEMATLAGWGKLLNESYPTALQMVDLNILPDCGKLPQQVGYEK